MVRTSHIVFVVFFAFSLNAQQRTDTTVGRPMFGTAGDQFLRPKFILPFSAALAATDDRQSVSLYHTLSGVPQSFAWDQHRSIDLTAPLKLQLQDSEKERPWKITLGAAQAAGTAYILYRHLKKYGFQ